MSLCFCFRKIDERASIVKIVKQLIDANQDSDQGPTDGENIMDDFAMSKTHRITNG
jgi:hypothetical protein